MVDPLSVVGTILTVVQLIGSAASTASQNKHKCLELAERAKNLGEILPSLAQAAAYDPATARVLERLRDAVSEALRLIQSCQSGGIFSGKYGSGKGAELDSVDKRINNCIMDLTLIAQTRAHTTTSTVNHVAAAGPAPAQTHVHVDHASYYHQAQGGAWAPPSPSLQHTWSAPPAPGYYQPPGYAHWVPSSPAPPAPSGSNLSSLYTLPTANKIFNRVFR
ncbi:unnamed protein product [Alopecurus aequalis]